MRYVRTCGAAVLVATGLAVELSCSDPSGPDGEGSAGSLEFTAADTELDFAAAGHLDFDIEGRPLFEDWAVAAEPDSLGGIVVTAFETSDVDGVGNLFILQLQPATSGVYDACGPNEACRGRLFLGWHTSDAGYDEWLEVTSGTVEVEELSESRVRGTFALTLRNEGGEGDESYGILDGRFDVPVDEGVGTFIACLPPAQACLSPMITVR